MSLLNLYEQLTRDSLLWITKIRQFHYWNKLYAAHNKKLKAVSLSKHEREQVQAYYSPYHSVKLKFHEFYKKATGNFYHNYIPDDIYYAYIDPYYNDWNMAVYVDNKCRYKDMFPGVRQPETLAYRENGFWYNHCGSIIEENEVSQMIASHNAPCFIKQAVESGGGHGVCFVDIGTGSADIQAKISRIKKDIVIQKNIQQSPILAALNPSSVNTIRLLTLLHKNGTVTIYSVILRMGIGGAKVDNASSGGITVGVEEDGKLKKIAYSASGMRFEQHPTSHINFDSITIPKFEEIKQLVKEQAVRLPHFRLISWDIALDKDNLPLLVEANLRFGELDFHQLNNGPLFGEDTESILEEVFADTRNNAGRK